METNKTCLILPFSRAFFYCFERLLRRLVTVEKTVAVAMMFSVIFSVEFLYLFAK